MTDTSFEPYINKLLQNVYQSDKGRIRLALLQKDIADYVPSFSEPPCAILDAGCGAGQFAKHCLDFGHRVCLLDASQEMITRAKESVSAHRSSRTATFRTEDFLNAVFPPEERYDLVLLHGSAEWMNNTEAAILKAMELLAPGGYLSLLMYNNDTHTYKKGVNGHLMGRGPAKKRKLFPPGALGVSETAAILAKRDGKLLSQSGIRIFHGFFRQIDLQIDIQEQPFEHWLAQEMQYFRTPPFCLFGQHSHFIWQKHPQPQPEGNPR